MVKLAEVQKFAREFSHGLDLNKELKFLTVKIQLISKCPFDIFKSPKKPTNCLLTWMSFGFFYVSGYLDTWILGYHGYLDTWILGYFNFF